jgi:hypothetical protein
VRWAMLNCHADTVTLLKAQSDQLRGTSEQLD